MQKYLLACAVLLLTCGFYYYNTFFTKTAIRPISRPTATTPAKIPSYKPAPEQLATLKKVIAKNHFNPEIALLIDMKLPSSQKRFFIYNLTNDQLIDSGLVTHGRCNEKWLEGRRYSNTIGGGCSSLGNYKTGRSYYGRFGLAYKLHGLDSTNNNAFDRAVVLHAHACVPETEVDYEICQSDGCPTVSLQFLKKLQKILDDSRHPLLLSIYESS